MKKSIISVFVIAAAAIALVSCNKEVPQNGEAPVQKASKVSFVASQPGTKAAFGTQSGTTLPTLWTSSDTKIFTALNFTAASGYYDFPALEPSSDGKTAYFDADLQDDGSGEYVFSLLSPSSAINWVEQYTHSDGNVYNLIEYTIPSVQTSGTSSPDEAAMILATVTDKLSAWPAEQLDVTFHHLTSYLKLDLQNLDLDEDENVTTVVISADANLAGTYAIDLEQGAGFYIEASGALVINTNGNNPVWVALNPIEEGTVLTIAAKTDANYQYEVKYTTPADLPAGTVAEVTVDYDGIMGSEVLFSYEDWLGTFTIDRYADGSEIDEITISQDEWGYSYSVYNVCSFGEEVPALYDATSGALMFINVDSLYTYNSSYGATNLWFRGWIPVSSSRNSPVNGGTYLIATATLDGNKAEIVPEEIELYDDDTYTTTTTYTFNGMGFGGDITEGQYAGYYLTYTGYGPTALPNTMKKATVSSAPKVNALGRAVPNKRLEGTLVKEESLKKK